MFWKLSIDIQFKTSYVYKNLVYKENWKLVIIRKLQSIAKYI